MLGASARGRPPIACRRLRLDCLLCSSCVPAHGSRQRIGPRPTHRDPVQPASPTDGLLPGGGLPDAGLPWPEVIIGLWLFRFFTRLYGTAVEAVDAGKRKVMVTTFLAIGTPPGPRWSIGPVADLRSFCRPTNSGDRRGRLPSSWLGRSGAHLWQPARRPPAAAAVPGTACR